MLQMGERHRSAGVLAGATEGGRGAMQARGRVLAVSFIMISEAAMFACGQRTDIGSGSPDLHATESSSSSPTSSATSSGTAASSIGSSSSSTAASSGATEAGAATDAADGASSGGGDGGRASDAGRG